MREIEIGDYIRTTFGIITMKKAKALEDEGKDDSEESKKILKRIDDKMDEFAVQMIKIAKLAQ